MGDKPILFSGAMVRAILASQKTVTRRILKDAPVGEGWHCDRTATGLRWVASAGAPSVPVRLRWEVGDRLWLKETWADVNTENGPALLYRADQGYHFCVNDAYPVEYGRYPGCMFSMWCGDLLRGEPGHKWRSPRFMPRWASRITLSVTAVRVERLQDITEADAIAEGAPSDCPIGYIPAYARAPHSYCFAQIWESINGPGAWEANPWVVAIDFKRIEEGKVHG